MLDAWWSRLALRAVTPQTGSVLCRERFSIRSGELAPLLHRLRAAGRECEWLVLSTCGRTEVYAAAREGTTSAVDDVIGESFLAVRPIELSPWNWPVRASGVDAARHLLRVAGGLESSVLGDVQLLGQLRTAYATARAQKTTGPLLNRLCQAALHAGKRARSETGIANGSGSMATAAVQLAVAHVGAMDKQRVLIVGGGRMGRAIASIVSKQGADFVTVATRDPEAFAAAGGTRHACAVRSDDIPALLRDADVVFTASGSGVQRITHTAVTRVMADRPSRPMLIMDLAIPREVDRRVEFVPGVVLADLEVLERSLERVAASRSAAIADVERIVEETLTRMLAWSPRPGAPWIRPAEAGTSCNVVNIV